jgi:ABC-2 type transport system ATP-binding protein
MEERMYIKLKDVTLKVGNHEILRSIDAEWEKGKIYGISGRNGSGKTMLFRVISGFWKPTAGEVCVDGIRIGKDNDFIQNAGVVIGEQQFIANMSGMDNLRLLAEIKKEIADREIEDNLRSVGLYEERNKKYRKYSLGMKQKLRLAQALM